MSNKLPVHSIVAGLTLGIGLLSSCSNETKVESETRSLGGSVGDGESIAKVANDPRVSIKTEQFNFTNVFVGSAPGGKKEKIGPVKLGTPQSLKMWIPVLPNSKFINYRSNSAGAFATDSLGFPTDSLVNWDFSKPVIALDFKIKGQTGRENEKDAMYVDGAKVSSFGASPGEEKTISVTFDHPVSSVKIGLEPEGLTGNPTGLPLVIDDLKITYPTVLTFENLFGNVNGLNSSLSANAPADLGAGVSAARSDQEKFFNYGAGFSNAASSVRAKFADDYLGFETKGNGAVFSFPKAVSWVSFVHGRAAKDQKGVFQVESVDGTVTYGKEFKTPISGTGMGTMSVVFNPPVTQFAIRFKSGKNSFMLMNDLSFAYAPTPILPTPILLTFEDLFGRVDGVESLKQQVLGQAIDVGCGVSVTGRPADLIYNFAGRYDSCPSCLEQSTEAFETDFIAVSTYDDGAKFKFPAPISAVSFQIHGQRVVWQGVFELLHTNGTLIREFGANSISETPTVTASFNPPVDEFVVRYKSGSSGLLYMDNLSFVPMSSLSCPVAAAPTTEVVGGNTGSGTTGEIFEATYDVKTSSGILVNCKGTAKFRSRPHLSMQVIDSNVDCGLFGKLNVAQQSLATMIPKDPVQTIRVETRIGDVFPHPELSLPMLSQVGSQMNQFLNATIAIEFSLTNLIGPKSPTPNEPISPPNVPSGTCMATPPVVDVAFVVDRSASMGNQVRAIRNGVPEFASAMQSKILPGFNQPISQLRFTLIAYEDEKDRSGSPWFIDGPWAAGDGQLSSALAREFNNANSGGSDIPEGGIMAVREALQIFAAQPEDSVKVVVLVTDTYMHDGTGSQDHRYGGFSTLASLFASPKMKPFMLFSSSSTSNNGGGDFVDETERTYGNIGKGTAQIQALRDYYKQVAGLPNAYVGEEFTSVYNFNAGSLSRLADKISQNIQCQ